MWRMNEAAENPAGPAFPFCSGALICKADNNSSLFQGCSSADKFCIGLKADDLTAQELQKLGKIDRSCFDNQETAGTHDGEGSHFANTGGVSSHSTTTFIEPAGFSKICRDLFVKPGREG
jgi:hypothetical protein